jgi:hypothetical protein
MPEPSSIVPLVTVVRRCAAFAPARGQAFVRLDPPFRPLHPPCSAPPPTGLPVVVVTHRLRNARKMRHKPLIPVHNRQKQRSLTREKNARTLPFCHSMRRSPGHPFLQLDTRSSEGFQCPPVAAFPAMVVTHILGSACTMRHKIPGSARNVQKQRSLIHTRKWAHNRRGASSDASQPFRTPPDCFRSRAPQFQHLSLDYA